MDFVSLKVDTFLDGGTHYIVFSERSDLPYPIRVENHAQVAVYAYQSESMEESQPMTVKPRQAVNYTWDEPVVGAPRKQLVVGVKGGTHALFEFNGSSLNDSLDSSDAAQLSSAASTEATKYLLYENFI